MVEEQLMKELDNFEYGCLDKDGNNIAASGAWKKEFSDNFHLLSPEELSEVKCGVCLDQVEYERDYLEKNNYKVESYFICLEFKEKERFHTFLVFYKEDKCYWLEHAIENYKGIHEYNNINELLKDVKEKYYLEEGTKLQDYIGTYFIKYEKPEFGIDIFKYVKYIHSFDKIVIE